MKLARGAIMLLMLALAACRLDMYNQPRTKPDSESNFFTDGGAARPLPAHVIAYHDARENEAFYTGLAKGDVLVAQMPLKLTPKLLERGQEQFAIYCAVCHGAAGDGNGEVVRRGFPSPPTYHSDRLRSAPIGHFFDVITNGYGVMYSYADRVNPPDRWAIAAYIRALQLSQHASPGDVPPDERTKLEAAK